MLRSPHKQWTWACRSGIFAVLLAFVAAPRAARANPFLGGTAATHATSAGAAVNPANAAFVPRTEVSASPVLLHSDSLQVRYPGFEATSDTDTGLGSPLVKPTFIYKVNPRLGIGGYALPPLPFAVAVEKERIPVVVLDQLNFVDIKGAGRLGGAAEAVVGYRFNDVFGVGVHGSFQKVTFNAELLPSEGGDAVASLTGSQTTTELVAGVRWDVVPRRFVLGAAAGVVRQTAEKLDVESPLLDAGGGDTGMGQTGSSGAVVNPLDSFLVGMQLGLGDRLRLYTDLEYKRAASGGKSISLVDLKEKERDLYSTLAVRVGVSAALLETSRVHAGFRYEPASLGPGSRDEDGRGGFGSVELVKLFAGLEELRPYWEIALGVDRSFGKRKGRRHGKRVEKAAAYYPWNAGIGLAYRRASLGIDEDGELPGAYLQTKVSVPAIVTYSF
jgi:hypothetical protein